MIRIITLWLSFGLVMLGVVGVTSGAAAWLVIFDFIAGGIGIAIDAVLWLTQGRGSVVSSLAMAVALAALFLAGIITRATSWLTWSIFGVAMLFFAFGCLRAFTHDELAGGKLL